jgi:anthranilate phosphoribosyltransferase
MRALSTKVKVAVNNNLIDTCGTGGSGSNKFNVSTAVAFVAASAGAKVAKHGNRGATSKSGSADVLEAAGVNLALEPNQVASAINEIGVGFMFAPAHHSAMKHVIAARREIGIRTIFNLLGPLTNPAAAPNQIIGVFDSDWIPILLEVLRDLGSSHILIVAAEDGLDEISTASSTVLGELCSGEISVKRINPEEFGIERIEDTNIFQVGSPEDSLNLIKQALVYEHQAAGDIVALNAGAAIYVANLADSLIDGVEKAKLIMRSGAALTKLEALVAFTKNLGK